MTSYHTVKYIPGYLNEACDTSHQSHWLMRRYLDDSCLVVAPSVFHGPNSFAHYMAEYSRQVSPCRSASERNHVLYSDPAPRVSSSSKSRVSVQYIVHSYKNVVIVYILINTIYRINFLSVLNFYNELFKNHNKTNSKLKLNPLSVVFSAVSLYKAVNFVSDPQSRHRIAHPWGRDIGCLSLA